MISVAEAHAHVQALLTATPIEEVSLDAADGRVLALPVTAGRAQPPFAASAMDGYALKTEDLVAGRRLHVVGEAAAGHRFQGSVASGEAVRIFTGAPLPRGSDTVLIQEDASQDGDHIVIATDPDRSGYVRPAGNDFAAGTVFPAPKRLTPEDVALLAAMNIARVQVHKRPDTAIIATGDELVWPGDTPGPDQIVASNVFGLKALLDREGASCRILPIARDTVGNLAATLDLAAGADLVITIGGASVGDHDLVAGVAARQGMDASFHKVAIRPGKPLMAGRLGTAPMIGLPGNPVSAMVCGHVFLRPAIRRMTGLSGDPLPQRPARLTTALDVNGPREHYMRARMTGADQNSPEVTAFRRQDSALLSVLGAANALIVRPPHDPGRPSGDVVSVLPLFETTTIGENLPDTTAGFDTKQEHV